VFSDTRKFFWLKNQCSKILRPRHLFL